MTEPAIPRETAKAAEAFAAYVAMGPSRSLRALASTMAEQTLYKNRDSALASLNTWSTKYRWQARISSAVTEKTERLLAQAAEIDATSYLRTSELIRERLANIKPEDTNVIIPIRESVRRPAPKGSSSSVDVNVQVSVSLRDMAERIAAEEGLDPDEVVAEAERYLRTGT